MLERCQNKKEAIDYFVENILDERDHNLLCVYVAILSLPSFERKYSHLIEQHGERVENLVFKLDCVRDDFQISNAEMKLELQQRLYN
jgi:hypothetical protein